jgi:signal transduction histidine kinase
MSASALPGRSLRIRLLAGSLVWIVGALTVTDFVLADLFRQHVSARFEAELNIHLDQLTASIESGIEGMPHLRAELSDPRLRKPYSGLYWQVDQGGPEVSIGTLRSRSLWDATLRVPADSLRDGEVHVHRIAGPDAAPLVMMERVIVLAEQPDRPLRLIVAADERGMTDPVREFVGLLAIALGVLAAGLIIAVVLQVSVGLAPLGRLREALAAVRDGRTRRVEGLYPSEVQPLVDELNTVLQHDAEVVTRARTEAGNLAHAVKTPLAVLGNAAARDKGTLARLVTEQVAMAQRQVDYHLARARAAAAVQVPGLRTPVRPILESLIRLMRHLHAERPLQILLDFGVDGSAEPAFRGEEQDLMEMLGNLIDNACKWTHRHIDVQASIVRGRLVIQIDDDGPGLLAAEREAVFGRGVRADEGTPGSGLGLAIVRDLARLYGGDVALEESPQGGLRAVLTLPAA